MSDVLDTAADHDLRATSEIIDLTEHLDPPPRWVDHTQQAPQRFSIALFLVMIWGIIGLTCSALIAFPVVIPATLLHGLARLFSTEGLSALGTLPTMWYSVQVPMVLLLTAVLGTRYAFFTLTAYVLLGLLGLPLFANGGGWTYIFEPSAGYLLGFIFCPLFMGGYVDRAFRASVPPLLGYGLFIPLAVLTGVLAIHLMGSLGLVVQLSFNLMSLESARQWVTKYTLAPFFYDCLFGCLVVSMTRMFRTILWLAFY